MHRGVAGQLQRDNRIKNSRKIVCGKRGVRSHVHIFTRSHVHTFTRWVDQNVFINVWNRKWNAKQEQTLNSFLDLVKQHNRPILNVLTAAAQAANSAAASGAKSSFEVNGETEKLIGKDDRLKMSHYQALAEQGCLQPGHPQIRWMREAFDVQALASKLGRDSLAQLQEAVE